MKAGYYFSRRDPGGQVYEVLKLYTAYQDDGTGVGKYCWNRRAISHPGGRPESATLPLCRQEWRELVALPYCKICNEQFVSKDSLRNLCSDRCIAAAARGWNPPLGWETCTPRTVPRYKLQNLYMSSGKFEALYGHERVICDGILKEYVGIGWINLRTATNLDKAQYPEAV